jgi:hypothetical protein
MKAFSKILCSILFLITLSASSQTYTLYSNEAAEWTGDEGQEKFSPLKSKFTIDIDKMEFNMVYYRKPNKQDPAYKGFNFVIVKNFDAVLHIAGVDETGKIENKLEALILFHK